MIDQRDLIRTALDDTLIVEAAAGTGKTTQLVARIVQLLATGRALITEIVAVTFSEKAAGELKLRLREELEKSRVAAPAGSAEGERLDAAVMEFEEAHVSTIHGFCAELLRERPVEARIDPSFEVLTEAASERLYHEAFGAWMEAALEAPGEGVKRSLRRPRRMSWWQDTEEGDGPIERLRRAGRDLLQWRDHPAPWRRPEWDREDTIDRVVQSVLDAAAMTASPIYERDVLFLDTASLRRTASEIARTARPSPRDYDGLEALLTTLATDRNLANKRKGSGAMYSKTVSRDVVLHAREGLIAALKTFRTLADADLAGYIHAELQSCVQGFERRKLRAGALDFLDLLILARDLVRDSAPVRHAFQRRFRYILVDEFQDTDPLQAELLMLLATDERAGGSRIRPGALFVVGDPKQSIYRFRRADIGMYQRICDDLARQHARPVVLQQSYRSVRNLQRFVNAAFEPVMQRDDDSLQPGYVPLAKHRDDIPAQPSVVALPVPRPYGRYRIAKSSIEKSLPEAIGEFVRWIVADSGWKVTAAGEAPRPVGASDVCLLFRRFIAYQDDITRSYVEALESRGVPHLLVGGKTFHEREEVDAIRTALCAIEWPEDELSVFATLHGPLFALGDEELLEYHARVKQKSRAHAFHPYHVPDDLPEPLVPIRDALHVLRELHAGRNYRPVADTLGRLMQTTRAHASFMLWKSGEQVLANVLHLGELARQYESEGGLSFRGFVETLRDAAERSQAPEAPILEEGSEGVRLMTVHKAKGLEFPVVILADITCGLSRDEAQRYLETDREFCAMKLAGWAPLELIENNDREARRDAAEGMRLAYVAATRARDVLVVPAIGDGPFGDSWVSPLNAALYPPVSARQSPRPAAGVPAFKSKDTVLERPDGDAASSGTVWPGEYSMIDPSSGEPYSVVWWDPSLIDRPGDDTRGLRRDDHISKEARVEDVAADRAR
jgi:ATP-dependent exoDNAse (exonuclease V) beta subunit